MSYFYRFKYGLHCICAVRICPIEYCGVKATADTFEKALQIIKELNHDNITTNN